MSEVTVSPEAIEAASIAVYELDHIDWNDAEPLSRNYYRVNMKAALEAAAPLIARQALLEASKSAWLTPEVKRWLSERANGAQPVPLPKQTLLELIEEGAAQYDEIPLKDRPTLRPGHVQGSLHGRSAPPWSQQ